jgi:hypothetical protein
VSSRKPLIWGVAALVAIVGGFFFWLQMGLLASIGALAWSGIGLQNHLGNAADGLIGGDYVAGQTEFEQADRSTEMILKSVDTSQVALIEHIPGIDIAIQNWRLSVAAAYGISKATGDLITLYGDLSGKSGGTKIFSDGAVDLVRLGTLPAQSVQLKGQIDEAATNLENIVATTFFADPLARIRDRALGEIIPIQSGVDTLNEITPSLPGALGANGTKRYLIAIGNQAEMRASGGAPLSLVMVEFESGRVSIPIKGQTSTQLFPPINAKVNWFGPSLNPFFPKNPRNKPFVNANTHPNFLYSAQEMMAAWSGKWDGPSYPEVDGVVTLDLTAIAAVLEATGPIQSEVFGEVTGERIGQILLIDAYQDFGQKDAAIRQEANQELLDQLLTRILSGGDLINAGQAILSTAPGRHFQMFMKDPALEQLALQSNAAGVVSDPHIGDWSALYTQNGNASKVDVFQQRNVLVNVNLEADGSARVTQQLTLTNATPADRAEGPPERLGYETSWLKSAYYLYVPDSATKLKPSYPVGFTVRPFRNHQQLGGGWVDDGFGHRFIRLVGWTPPGGQSAVSVTYELPAGTFSDGDTSGDARTLTYRVQAEVQSLLNDSTITFQVTGPAGFTPIRQPGMKVSEASGTVSAVQSGPVNAEIGFKQ